MSRRAAPIHSGRSGRASTGLPHQLGQRLRTQSVGQRIDRFDQRQGVAFVRFDDVVGMGDLLFAVEDADLARNDSPLADRQRLFNPAAFGAEKDQLHLTRFVVAIDPVRRRAASRWCLMTINM